MSMGVQSRSIVRWWTITVFSRVGAWTIVCGTGRIRRVEVSSVSSSWSASLGTAAFRHACSAVIQRAGRRPGFRPVIPSIPQFGRARRTAGRTARARVSMAGVRRWWRSSHSARIGSAKTSVRSRTWSWSPLHRTGIIV